MNAVSNGMDAEFDKSMAMMGQNVVYVEKQPWGGGPDYEWWKYRNRREMKLSYVDQIRESSELTSVVSAAATGGTKLRYEDKSSEGVFMALGVLAGNGTALWIKTESVIPIWAVILGFFGMFVVDIVFVYIHPIRPHN